MATTHGGELVARTLAAAGVRHAFGIHGGHLDPIITSMARHGITLVDTRHEAAAGNAAEGYARATGGIGVAFATAGPGFTNVFSALANAYVDRIPMLLLTSSPPLREAELNVLQGNFDQLAAASAVTRWAHRVTTASRIPDLIALAIRHATAGVRGPVLLEFPIDVLSRPVEEATATTPTLVQPEPPGPSAHALAVAGDLLASAEHPLIVIGGGAAVSPGMADALQAFVEHTKIPVVVSSWGYGVLPQGHPCLLGNSAELATLSMMGQAPDVVLLLGARRGLMLGSRSNSMIPAAARVIQVDVDGVEPGRIGSVDLAVRADVAEFVRALAASRKGWPSWAAWNDATKVAQGAHAFLYAGAEPVTPSGRLHPYFAAKAVIESLGPETITVYDGGEVSAWMAFFARAHRPRSWFGCGMMGGLGIGPGFAIGAQVARPEARVVLVSGDGALGFHLPEFNTMVRHRLPITTVVFNNLGWGMSLHGQQAIYGTDTRVIVDLPDTRYDQIAAAFGLYAERVDRPEEIGPAMQRAAASGRPACLDLAIAPEIVHPMMEQVGLPVPEGYTRIPYYEPVPPGEA
ncbi:MAG: bznB [Deltaproteobacteria bacterium]|nr:bznB [Deltaproteobacteria bacterium]